ncbi:4Fe-4S binding protein [Synechococcus sp. RSCCF101]|uniref:cyclic nucleotide-binding domain-containing protein n=1 Tax=Synechococcus sp. RSCCF101 TaxID=2511069 RepID=UPI001248EE77|nr:cyclic nucleotide-binding domain-containing protein [Synechococcus sp. RSCCF101]QEY32295.1 4Fe-4S binding protein [Synechococcus sp. RSCCF101]
MQVFSRWPERQAHLVRWLLLAGWLVLIASLFTGLPFASPLPAVCPGEVPCTLHAHPGNRLFWGVVVPSGVLLIVAGSHELWRRICPLAFVSQTFRALGLQRRRPGRGGRMDVVSVERGSWLGRRHVQLQWSLLMAGLVLRLVLVNSQPLALGVLLLLTLLAALAVGWAYGGKAWCQYVCPMGPVQQILVGPRSLLGGTAHVGTDSRLTQSICRTTGAGGGEKLACVGCQAPCIDIDSEKTFWQGLSGKAGLDWAWLSYPGLVIGFFLLMGYQSPGGFASLAGGQWAFDVGLPERSLQAGRLGLPRLLEISLLLSAAGGVSVLILRRLERGIRRRLEAHGHPEAGSAARGRVRLLATALAINAFFWFADPTQGQFGPLAPGLIRTLVAVVSGMWLMRNWRRDEATYRRESQLTSLRRQLARMVDATELATATGGRRLEDMGPDEVFTLVKTLPALGQRQARAAYREVMREQLSSGRLQRAAALLQLEDLRRSLGLEDDDHHEVVRQLAEESPELLERDDRQRQIDDLRLEAARENLQEFVALTGLGSLDPSSLQGAQRERFERIRTGSGLDDAAWTGLLEEFGPAGERQRHLLLARADTARRDLALRALLLRECGSLPLLRPLAVVMDQRCLGTAELLGPELRAAGLPPLPELMPAEGTLDEALDRLWHDPDPDTAGWVLMVERQHRPERVAQRLVDARIGLGSSPFLELQRRGEPHPDGPEFPVLARCEWMRDLTPAALLHVAEEGELCSWEPHETVLRRGDPSESLIITLEGEALVQRPGAAPVRLGVAETVGEMGLILQDRRSRDVIAGPEGLRGFVISRRAFESLLLQSRRFSDSLLRLMARRLRA